MSVVPEIRVCPPDQLAAAAAELVAAELRASVEKRMVARIALAGGGTPAATYRALASEGGVPWADVHVYFGDERCVAADDPSSNYRMAHAAMLSQVAIPESNILRIKGELPPRAAAADYAETLGHDPLDIVLLGMGADGHTASLFPDTDLDDPTPVLATRSPVPPADRVSLGLRVINAAGVVVFLIGGAAKASRVAEVHEQILAGEPVLPAARVQPNSGRLIWLLDTDAASTLESDA